MWIKAGGGSWDTGSNWNTGQPPGPNDTAVIDLTSAGTVTTGPSDSVRSLSTNSLTTVSVSNGSLTLGVANPPNVTSTINGSLVVSGSGSLQLDSTTLLGTGTLTDAGHLAGNFTLGLKSTTMSSGSALTINGIAVQSGATLTVGTNASVTIADSQVLSVSGQLNVTGASVVIDKNDGGGADGILVNNGGTMTVSNSSFSRNTCCGNGENVYLQVSAGGHLIATNSYFGLDNLYLDPGSVLKNGDLSITSSTPPSRRRSPTCRC